MLLKRALLLSASAFLLFNASTAARAGDWAEWRGPRRDGISPEKNLPTKWSPAGENLSWKAPYGGRSTPVVFGDRLYLLNAAGKGPTLQERLVAFNADTGKVLWEHRFDLYLSDVPPHRIAWASPAVDTVTGNVYALGGAGVLLGLSPAGKVLWERSLGEDFGLLTTHGGRTVSPLIDGDLVIVSGVTFQWGQHAGGAHRWLAFDKRTGETIYVSGPGGRPYDTTYAAPIIAEVAGTRLLIQGGSDGVTYAIKPQTGEMVWKYEISKRGINTGAVVFNGTAILTHSEENLESNEMGMMLAVNAAARGELKKEDVLWTKIGWQGGFSSPVLDGERLYQLDNGANVAAFDVKTGRQLWIQNLGTIQKASPVLADGKLYVGTENGKFFILEPGPTGAKVLDEDQLGTEQQPEAIIASVAVSNGRVFLVTDSNLYAIGRKLPATASAHARDAAPAPSQAPTGAAVAYVQVVPTELIIKPGDKVSFRVRSFDAQGRMIREEKQAEWSLDKLKGTVAAGQFASAADGGWQGGLVKATVGGVTGSAAVRIVPPLPWNETFDSWPLNAPPVTWVNATPKFVVQDQEGNKVLVKTTTGSSLVTRARAYMGPSDLRDYTVEADIKGTMRRRQQGDAGVIAQRHVLVLYGNKQELSLEPWQPETERTVKVPFEWKPDVWYRMKLTVENLPGGKTRARGKVWPVGQPEPAAWIIDHTDVLPHRQGAPGIYGNALAESQAAVFFDNIKVTPNR
ncbi:MAG TPA: PQQ-binding-like beta-propeller repeat protein [Pyrinomonadaceae bacterium]|nr:PQQ-binding-like beta-propeller repeat protein [Pyrinomonadaceae bacterium]